jgi:hypothetical protein
MPDQAKEILSGKQNTKNKRAKEILSGKQNTKNKRAGVPAQMV